MVKLGPTGKFPRGKFVADDEGELNIGITVKDKVVIVAFGISVKWIGLDPETARLMAASLLARAKEIDGKDVP